MSMKRNAMSLVKKKKNNKLINFFQEIEVHYCCKYVKIFVQILIEKDMNTKFNPLTFALVSKDSCFTPVTS